MRSVALFFGSFVCALRRFVEPPRDAHVPFASRRLNVAPPISPGHLHAHWLAALYAAPFILFLWIMGNVPLVAHAHADADDALFVRGAYRILSGHWLGPYDDLTFVKGPFYSIWIALNWIVGLPLLVSQGALYGFACLLLVRGLRPWLRSETATFVTYVILLFNPASYSIGQLRVLREGIYVPMTVLLFALLVWLYRWRFAPMGRRVSVALCFGLTLGCYWCTREEGPWVIPPLLLAFGLICLASFDRSRTPWLKLSAQRKVLTEYAFLAGFAVSGALAVLAAIGALNMRYYGISDIVEIKQPEFLAAYGAVAKVGAGEGAARYIVISPQGLEHLFASGEAAAELRPYFESQAAKEVAQATCTQYNVDPCDGAIRSELFFWAFRDAVAKAGHYTSAVEARAYYVRLASEIAAACAEARLSCNQPPFTLPPPFQNVRPEYLPLTVQAIGHAARFLISLETLSVPDHALHCTLDDCGRDRAWSGFFEAVHTDLFVPIPWIPFPQAILKRSDDGHAMPFRQRSDLVKAGLDRVIAGYRAILPVTLEASLAAFLVGLGVCLWRCDLEPMLAVAGVAGAVLVTRVVLLSYLDVTSLPAINSTYLSPAYPAIFLFAAASVVGFVNLVQDLVRDRQRANSPHIWSPALAE